jgi:hypothetical protein
MASGDQLTQIFENSVAVAIDRPVDEIVDELAAVLRPAPERPSLAALTG